MQITLIGIELGRFFEDAHSFNPNGVVAPIGDRPLQLLHQPFAQTQTPRLGQEIEFAHFDGAIGGIERRAIERMTLLIVPIGLGLIPSSDRRSTLKLAKLPRLHRVVGPGADHNPILLHHPKFTPLRPIVVFNR